jgi:hypothetical protein
MPHKVIRQSRPATEQDVGLLLAIVARILKRSGDAVLRRLEWELGGCRAETCAVSREEEAAMGSPLAGPIVGLSSGIMAASQS